MKTNLKLRVLLAMAIASLPLTLIAADAASSADFSTIHDLVNAFRAWSIKLIPVLVPGIIMVIKAYIPRLPKVWLPIIAPVLGALIDWLAAQNGAADPTMGAIYGSAGVGLREILDQLNKNFPKVNACLALLMVIPCLLFGPGCQTKLAPGGAYAPATFNTNSTTGVVTTNATAAPDVAFYTADAAFLFASTVADTAFRFERDNREALWKISPDIKHTLDKMRPQATEMVTTYAAARAAYRANPTPAGLDLLQGILAKMQQLSTAASAAVSNLSTSTTNAK